MKGIQLQNLHIQRSGALIVRDLTLDIPSGEITVLLGPNGAGKSTLLDAISHVIPTQSGAMILNGESINQLGRLERVNAGLSYVEQGRQIFSHLSVEQNIRAACDSKELADKGITRTIELFPELQKRLNTAAGMLSGGEQQMIVLARSIIKSPQVMLIDELSLGLAPIVVSRFLPILKELKQSGMAILLVEQFANAALEVGDRAAVLVHGECVLNESCDSLRGDHSRLHNAYMGIH
ncbi:ABC transporter ATP-binding protein [Marinomonas sp.]|uniref:ABC transporter ATP-binding protein n=1 Tax=Marinomonas sp. TaxID=1904862 RepID=UPI003BAC511F